MQASRMTQAFLIHLDRMFNSSLTTWKLYLKYLVQFLLKFKIKTLGCPEFTRFPCCFCVTFSVLYLKFICSRLSRCSRRRLNPVDVVHNINVDSWNVAGAATDSPSHETNYEPPTCNRTNQRRATVASACICKQ